MFKKFLTGPMKVPRTILFGLLFIFAFLAGSAQTKAYSLKEAVQYALQHQASIRLARFDEYIAQKKVKDLLGTGLPQLTANFNFSDNLIQRTSVIPASSFNPAAPADAIMELKFGVQYSTDANAQLTQLIFDGSFLVGLQASKIYADLTHRQVELAQTEVAATVSKAYYTALMSEEQYGVLGLNIERLEKLFNDTKAMNEAGFVEKIDVDRLEINLNNLQAEQVRVERMVALTRDLLKFQMGMDPNLSISLTDTIDLNTGIPIAANFGDDSGLYKKRLEYSLMETQRELHLINAKRIRMANLPSVAAFGNLGTTWMNDDFDLFKARKWYPYALIGLQASMPLFSGGRGNAQVAISKLEAEKVSVNMELFKNAVSMEVRQARTSVMNSTTTLQSNKNTVELAEEVYRVSQIKYNEGVGSSLEVIQAESGLREAQTNYLASLYEYFIAQIDLRKASGELLKK